jgi:DNA-binding response OmpR family regulator
MDIDLLDVGVGVGALEALLVEDDDLDARILQMLADMNGECAVNFTHARTITEAKALTRDGKYDMYFIDLNVGEGSALSLLANLERAGVRPVVVSNVTASEARRYRLNAGSLRFLPKSECTPASVGALVREALVARRSAMS